MQNLGAVLAVGYVGAPATRVEIIACLTHSRATLPGMGHVNCTVPGTLKFTVQASSHSSAAPGQAFVSTLLGQEDQSLQQYSPNPKAFAKLIGSFEKTRKDPPVWVSRG